MSEESKELSRDLHILGKVSGYYGVKGWVKIYSYTQPRENIVRYKALKIKFSHNNLKKHDSKQHDSKQQSSSNLSVKDEWQDIQLDSGKAHGKGVVAHFSGYDDRDAAVALIGAELAVHRSEFKHTGKDEYYWTDLIDLLVVNLDDVELGRVSSLIETAANDVLVIRSIKSDKTETLVPFILEHYVKKVDLDTGTILVDWSVDWNESN